MKSFLLLLSLLPLTALSSEIDQRLQGYVKEFGLRALPNPAPTNPAIFKLGRALFMTQLLSGNKNIGCVDCHFPGEMTHDALPLSLGEGAHGRGSRNRVQLNGKIIARNSPALFNLDGVTSLFWDGRISYDPNSKTFTTPLKELNGRNPLRRDITKNMTSALAAQSIFPIADAAEMRGEPGSNKIADAASELEAWELIVERLLSYPEKKSMFEAAFPGQKINIGHVGEALAEFQRIAFFRADTAYDRYLKGDLKAMNDIQKKGMDIFFDKGKCGNCHNGAYLSSFEFENIGVPQIGPGKKNGIDLGRYLLDPSIEPFTFRIPPLRNVGLTAPYMHNGAFDSLERVVEHYENVPLSLRRFKLDITWKNYSEAIKDHDHTNDSVILANLAPDLSPRVLLSQGEEEALLEFLSTALTDVKFLRYLPQE